MYRLGNSGALMFSLPWGCSHQLRKSYAGTNHLVFRNTQHHADDTGHR